MSRRQSSQMAWQGGSEWLFYIPVNYINVPLTFSVRGNAHLRQKEFHFQEEYKKHACQQLQQEYRQEAARYFGKIHQFHQATEHCAGKQKVRISQPCELSCLWVIWVSTRKTLAYTLQKLAHSFREGFGKRNPLVEPRTALFFGVKKGSFSYFHISNNSQYKKILSYLKI